MKNVTTNRSGNSHTRSRSSLLASHVSLTSLTLAMLLAIVDDTRAQDQGAGASASTSDKSQIFAHASDSTFWIAQVGPPLGQPPATNNPGTQTDIIFRPSGAMEWRPLQRVSSPIVELSDYRSDLVGLLKSGEWMVLWRGGSSTGQRLPRGATMRALGSSRDTLWAVGSVQGGIASLGGGAASTQASTTATSTTQPATRPAAAQQTLTTMPSPRLVLFALEAGVWSPKADLPDSIVTTPGRIALSVIDKQPIVAAHIGSSFQLFRYGTDQSWTPLGEIVPKFDAVDFKLLTAPGRPMLWVAPVEGAGVLYTTTGAGGWSPDPIELTGADGLTARSERAITIASERIRLLYTRDGKMHEQSYELNGAPVGEPLQLLVQAGPPSETIYQWINIGIMAALMIVIIGTLRKRVGAKKSGEKGEKSDSGNSGE